MSKPAIAFLTALIILVLQSGCGDKRILEELGFIHTVSFDLIAQEQGEKGQELKVTVAIPKANRDGKIQRETLSATGKTNQEARIKLSMQTELSLMNGQVRNTLFGIDLAKKGIMDYMDTFLRDPSFSQRVKITIAEGNAHDLLVKEYPQHPRTGQYIERMLDKEVKRQTVPEVTLYQFTRDLFDDGIDPVAPIVKQKGQKNVAVSGIALFNDDKYVTKIEPSKSLIFSLISGKFKQGDINIDLEGEQGEDENRNQVMFTSLVSKRKLKVTKNTKDVIEVRLDIHMKGSLLEYVGQLELSETKDRKKLESLVIEYLKDETEKMIQMMQKNKVDSIGIGRVVRNSMSYKEWKQIDWKQVYPNVKVTCNVEFIIRDYGKLK